MIQYKNLKTHLFNIRHHPDKYSNKKIGQLMISKL